MTVSTTLNKVIYQGNGSSTVFPFTFPGVAAADIQVYYTDTSGNVTLLASSVYTLFLTTATGTNPTGAGGSVTYNPSGTPIATGTSLTILRTLPFSQLTSFANQGNLWQPVVEQAFDYAMMAVQQVEQQVGQQLTVPVSDPVPGALPSATTRALKFLAFDASGNPIASNTGATTTPVSSAMAPVVAAATLAAGRTAFGLGNVAVEAIGLGLADSAGSLQVQATPVADSTNQSVTSTFHTSFHFATGALTYTLPRANTLFAGFQFTVLALTGACTFAINGADKFSGGTTGVSMVIQPGTQATIITDAAGAGTWFVANQQQISYESPLNLQINASVATNQMTISVKDRNGNDPTTASPVIAVFRDPTLTNGDPVVRALTSALSITLSSPATLGGAATLGTVSGNPSRLWVVLIDNAGTLVLGVYIASSATQIFSLQETDLTNGTIIVSGSNSPGIVYTQASAVSSKSYRIIGFVESTQATAGTWATSPSKIQLFGPGVKKPGDVVQTLMSRLNTAPTGNTAIPFDDTVPQITEGAQFFSLGIVPTAGANLLNIHCEVMLAQNNAAAASGAIALFQDATANALMVQAASSAAQNNTFNAFLTWDMVAATTSTTTFTIRIGDSAGDTFTMNGNAAARKYGGVAYSFLRITEYMG